MDPRHCSRLRKARTVTGTIQVQLEVQGLRPSLRARLTGTMPIQIPGRAGPGVTQALVT